MKVSLNFILLLNHNGYFYTNKIENSCLLVCTYIYAYFAYFEGPRAIVFLLHAKYDIKKD